MASVVYFIVPLVLLAFGIPIYAILLFTSLIGILFISDVPLSALQTLTYGSLDGFGLLAIVLFVLAGDIMGRGGIAKRLVAWVVALVGGIRGSLGIATIVSAEIFGAISGSSVACVAAIGRLVYPELKKSYGEKFAASLITSSGAIAVIIPPSIPMIIYGVAAQQSIPKLFIAGIVPGILIGLIVCTYIFFFARIKNIRQEKSSSWAEFRQRSREVIWALGAPVVILGGIYGGVFTPTEAAGVAVVYSVLVSRFIYKDVTWHELWQIVGASSYLISQILLIVVGAGLYAWLVTTSGIPQSLMNAINGLGLPLWLLLLIFNIVLLIVGSFLEPTPAILIFTPFILPTVQAMGMDLIHFGIVMTVNLAIGMFLPPFGLNIFAGQAIFQFRLSTLYRGVLPFLALYCLALALVTYIPELSMALVRYMW